VIAGIDITPGAAHRPAALMVVQAMLGVTMLAITDAAPSRAWAVPVAAVSIAGAWTATRRARALADTPSSRIASAPQGYVELVAAAQLVPGWPVIAPVSGRACVWFRHRVDRDGGGGRRELDAATSDAPFDLVEGDVRCTVHPAGAEVLAADTRRWSNGDERGREELITAGERVHVLGHFTTTQPPSRAARIARERDALLTAWKAERPQLLSRFDADASGDIDLTEWEAARAEALRLATLHVDAEPAPQAWHTLTKPTDGRLFLVSSADPATVARRFRWWAAGHAAVLVVAVAFGVGVLHPR
jgi:hypothetical protein